MPVCGEAALARPSNPLVGFILDTVARYGLDPDAVTAAWTERSGRSAETLGPDDLTPLFRVMAERSPDPDLGLHVAECIELQAFSPLIYGMLSSLTLGEAFGMFIRFADLVEGRESLLWTRSDPAGQFLGWRALSPDGVEDRHHHEFVAAGAVVGMRFVAGVEVIPAQVRFGHRKPASTAEHRRILGVEPRFDCRPGSGMVLAQATWDLRSAHGDPTLQRVHEGILASAQAGLQEDELVQRVRRAVRQRLEEGATMADVARTVGTSQRSLQRRLGSLDTSFRAIVEEERRARACELLATTDASIEAVALSVGFAEPSSLHRAFIRWTGQTPQAWRDGQRRG